MSKGVGIVIMFALIFSIAALQNVVPLFESQAQAGRGNTSTRIDFSYASTHTLLPAEGAPQPLVHVPDYHDVEQGSLFFDDKQQPGFSLSPQLDTRVQMHISAMVARTTISQTFQNTSSQWLNGIYVFPLPQGAAVDHLSMRIGQRHIEGQIQPKRQAQAIYEQAKLQGKKASLLTQQRPNLFTNAIANIGPGEKVIVTLEFQQKVDFAVNQFSIRLPITVAKRYMPPAPSDPWAVDKGTPWVLTQPSHFPPEASGQTAPVASVARPSPISIDIQLDAGLPLETLFSPSHAITKTHRQNQYQIRLANVEVANRDFVLNWQAKPAHTPQAAHFTQQTEAGHYGMVMLMPPAQRDDRQRISREAIFVLDTSGSMQGRSMGQAKQALKIAIQQLSNTDHFNLIEFDSSARKLWRQALPATQQNKELALQHVEQLVADGGTHMLNALQQALAQQHASSTASLRQVIFITDGAVANEAHLFEFIANNLQDSRLFTVGIGSAPNSFFMSEAARMGKGTFTFIDSTAQVQAKMNLLFDKLRYPVLTDLLARFSEPVEFYPQHLPDLYQGEPLVLSYRSAAPTSQVNISGSLNHAYWSQSMNLEQGAQGVGLDVFWARNKIADLERSKRMGGDHLQLNQHIEQLALAHHLVSSQTSLVAVDLTPTATDIAEDVSVLSQAPAAQIMGVLPQTATPATLLAYLGWLLIGTALWTIYIQRRA